jgi:hypothetical protein
VRDDSATPLPWVEAIRKHYVELVKLDVMFRVGRSDYELYVEFPMVLLEPPKGGSKAATAEAHAFDVAKAALELADAAWKEVVAYTQSTVPRADYQLVGYGFKKADTNGEIVVLFEVVKQCWQDYLGGMAMPEEDQSPATVAMRALTVALSDSRGREAAAEKRGAEFHKLAIGALQAAPDVINKGCEVVERGIEMCNRGSQFLEEASHFRAEALAEYTKEKRWETELLAKQAQTEKFADVAAHGIDVMGSEVAKGVLLLVQILAEERGVSTEKAPETLMDACDQFSDSITVKQQAALSADCAMELFSVLEVCSKHTTELESASALVAFLATYREEMNLLKPLTTPRQKSLLRYIDGAIKLHVG